MNTSTMFKPNFDYKSDLSHETHSGLNSVFAAAVVNQSFREALLRNPEAALDQGYLGRGFSLTQKETSLILSINASSLADLARQVILESRK
ncbi:MAG: hypothetical protein WBW94_01025 [Anaerolineales bacterium]|jgi:hypothetical protein